MSMSHELSKLLHEADMLQGHKYGQVSNIIANASPDLRRRLAEAIYPEGAQCDHEDDGTGRCHLCGATQQFESNEQENGVSIP